MTQEPKDKYRIRNWNEYNQSLVNRGSITFWFDPISIEKWHAKRSECPKGRPSLYSDEAILCALTIKAVFHLTFRATEGFLIDIIRMMGLELICPDYTSFCRRAKNLKVPNLSKPSNEPLHVVFDSTGLKVYGEGEWKVRKYGYTKRRKWKKLHIAMCLKTQEILVNRLSDQGAIDADPFPEMMGELTNFQVEQVVGDGGYDKVKCYQAIHRQKAKAVIPPQIGARKLYRKHGDPIKNRDETIDRIKELGQNGRKEWKKETGYHKRSLVETAMYRLKRIFGDKLRCRKEWSEATEASIRCTALNRMTSLGMPQSYKTA